MEKQSRHKIQTRLSVLGVVVVLCFFVLGANLWRLQIAGAEYYAEMAEGNVLKNVSTSPVRGEIVDAGGTVLARSEPVFAVTLDWTDLRDLNKNREEVVSRLAGYIEPYWPYANQSVELITEDILVMIQNQQRQNYQSAVILENIPSELRAVLAEHSNELPGVNVTALPERVYPQGTRLGQVLGYVREISEEEMTQFNADGDFEYRPGDFVGKMGVEKSYDAWLRGERGLERVSIDGQGRPIDKETLIEAKPGYTVQLTVDLELQKTLEDALDKVVKEIQKKNPKAQVGAAVVLDVKTGGILAMASRPYMDPNELIGNISEETAERYFNSEEAASFNRALTGLYAPGSTFKMLVGMAGLETGVVTEDTYFNDVLYSLGGAGIMAQGVPEWGGNNFGRVNIYSALAHSSNIYFQIVGRRTVEKEPEFIRQLCLEFGLGAMSGVDLPGEAEGIAPSPSWKNEYFKPYYDRQYEANVKSIEEKYAALLQETAGDQEKRDVEYQRADDLRRAQQLYESQIDFNVNWRPADSFYNAIGQSYNSYTILQLANYVAAIVNGGYHYRPHVVDRVLDPFTGETVWTFEPEVLNQVSVSPRVLAIVKEGMAGVTRPGGTAGSLFADTPQFSGGGKTGTAQQGSKDTAFGKTYNGMFVAFAPYDDPQIAFASVIEFGDSGGGTSGLVAKEVFKQYFGW
ncbi:MAG: penicillin-binding protein 2 [Gracilibacteraceae bacterium]|jgi:penicillin-binding protein 2|nr:penicillin-binding protein 2 [Gracilibacteraceae bacterium]